MNLKTYLKKAKRSQLTYFRLLQAQLQKRNSHFSHLAVDFKIEARIMEY